MPRWRKLIKKEKSVTIQELSRPRIQIDAELHKLCSSLLTITVYGPVPATYALGRIYIPAFAPWKWEKDGASKTMPQGANETVYQTPLPRERIKFVQVYPGMASGSQNNPATELLGLGRSSSTETTFNPSMIEA